MLDAEEVERFVADGFVRLDDAIPRSLAEECRALLWRDLERFGCARAEPATWTWPVVRLPDRIDEPFRRAANTPALHAAFDALVGAGRWQPRGSLGFPVIRFPSEQDPGDTGWHVDASFAGRDSDPNDYLMWRVNVFSRGRALLLLVLLSDVGPDDAPTRILTGSHVDVARLLAPAGEDGLTALELARRIEAGATTQREQALAVGAAGTVYLCHPLLVHAAQRHRGREPRFLAQPPLLPASPLALERTDARYAPVERAIREALGLSARTSG